VNACGAAGECTASCGWQPEMLCLNARRCGARTRRHQPCQAPAIKGKKRCRMHGGLSTGPTPDGLERSRRARWKHGRFCRAAIEARRVVRWETREEGMARLERESRRDKRRMARDTQRFAHTFDRLLDQLPD
jgi:glucans biosynthesis protein